MEPRDRHEADICASNNVDWYEAIFESHGLTGVIADGMWTSNDAPPPYYSNAVTLDTSDPVGKVARLSELDGLLRTRWSAKDSYSSLDLSPLGFRPLFQADWIWCDASDVPTQKDDGITWRPITTTDQLEEWETAWRANGSPTDSPVFVADLLKNAAVSLFGGYRQGAVVAGCAGNRSADAVGFSNFFAADDHEHVALPGGIEAVARFGDGRPVVGYLAGDGLARVIRLGFRSVGPLRVWMSGTR